jgi:hypothetical protein
MGKIPYSRAYYWGEDCHHSGFPTDEEFGLLRKQTPAVQQLTAMAGAVSPFEEGAERLLQKMSGVRLSESTVQRTTEDVGAILNCTQAQGDPVAPQTEWAWHCDRDGRSCAYLSLDATGVRQQGPHGKKADGRMAWVMEVFNPVPQPSDSEESRPEETRLQSQARYAAGLMDISEAGRRLRTLAESVGFQKAEVVIGLTDGGNGLAECLETHCLSALSAKTVLILDFYHLSEHLEGFAREWCKDTASQTEFVKRWCHMAKHEGGQALLDELESLDLKGCRRDVKEKHRCLTQYVGKNLFRMNYPRYEKAGWQIGSGNIESACKTVINQRLNGGGMRWCERGTNTVSHVRALFRSESTVWENFWRNRSAYQAKT